MLSLSKIRLLRHLLSLNRAESKSSIQGLTLIELLIVIVILGILAAIASTSFINAATRAKESEAQVNIGAILRGQQSHYLEHSSFADNLNALGLGVSAETRHYRYEVRLTRQDNTDIDGNILEKGEASVASAEPLVDIRGYMGKAWLDPYGVDGNSTTRMVVCKGGINATNFMNAKTYCP